MSPIDPFIQSFPSVAPGDVKVWGLDFVKLLGTGQSLTGTPSAIIVDETLSKTSAGGIINNVQINGTQVVFQLVAGSTYGTYYVTISTEISGLPYPTTRSGRYQIQFK